MMIKLHIDELVLHGLPPADRHRITGAVKHELQQELARLLADAPEVAWRTEAERVDAGSFPAEPRPEALGHQIARAALEALR